MTLWNKERQDVLVPRIPDISGPHEEVITERISLAPTIRECISGMGDLGVWNEGNLIRVYMVNMDENDTNLVDWKTLYESGKVHDTPLTHEYWYKDSIVPVSYFEYRVDSIKTKSHFVIKAEEKDRVISIITEVGIGISDEMKSKTALEILEHYRSFDCIEAIKSRLVHKEMLYDENGIEMYRKIFKEEPKQFEEIPDYFEMKYVDDCNLTRIL